MLYQYVWFVCILLCSLVSATVLEDLANEECNREISRATRHALEQYVISQTEAVHYEIPETCPWRPELDMYRDHEAHKKRVNSRHFKCKYCGKNFKSEGYLDSHLGRKHSDAAPGANICLQDYCEIFGTCHATDVKKAHERILPHNNGLNCDEHDMNAKHSFCRAMVQKCFPAEAGQIAFKLHEKLQTTLCAPFTCDDLSDLSDHLAANSSVMSPLILTFVVVALLAYYVLMFSFKKRHQQGTLSLASRRSTSQGWKHRLAALGCVCCGDGRNRGKLF